MKIPDAEGILREVPVKWFFARSDAGLFPYPHSFGSSAYYPDHGFDLPGPGEIVEYGRVRARREDLAPAPGVPCPDNPLVWNPREWRLP